MDFDAFVDYQRILSEPDLHRHHNPEIDADNETNLDSGMRPQASIMFHAHAHEPGHDMTPWHEPYVVDENTPNSELWVPDTDGTVLPGDTYNITVPVQGLIPYREPLSIQRRRQRRRQRLRARLRRLLARFRR